MGLLLRCHCFTYTVIWIMLCALPQFNDSLPENERHLPSYIRREKRDNEGCILPDIPPNGSYSLPNTNVTVVPGETVAQFTVIQFTCQKGYTLYPQNVFLICLNQSEWDKPIPECKQACSSLTSSNSSVVECLKDGKFLDNCNEPMEGTTASFYCNDYHETIDMEGPYRATCQGGRWDEVPPECFPVCGKMIIPGLHIIVGGNPTIPHEFPWHVGIYRSNTKSYICGGSIIRNDLIVSAAHCFTNLHNGQLYPKENYLIAAGKHYRDYSDSRDDRTVQYPTIEKILIHPGYKGEIRYHASDFALIKLKEPLQMTPYVLPVCINLNVSDKLDLDENDVGKVIGWGWTTEGGNPSEKLQSLDVPYVPQDKCFDVVPEEYKYYITEEKLCAGYQNKGAGSCRGDSGGGLIFQKPLLDFGKRYFLIGITSVSATSTSIVGGCDTNNFAGHTDIRFDKYINFINKHI